MRKIKVLVACGAGIATSTVVMKRIEDLLQDNNIEADVEQIKIAEAVSKQEGADMLISTTILPTQYKIPAITWKNLGNCTICQLIKLVKNSGRYLK